MRWLPALFAALVVLYLIPIWAVLYIPTADGPSHVYNSWVIKELIRGDAGIIERAYRIDWRPHPNWLGHAVMAALMFVVAPVVAEKLLFSLIIILFLGGTWMLCDAAGRECRPYAFFAFPFAYHQLLQTGFYNFSLSLGLHLVILAVWWRRRDRPSAGTIALIATLLVLCYFSHPMSALIAIGSLGLLWLFTIRGRRFAIHVRHLIAFLPVVPLLIWFLRQRATEQVVVTTWPARKIFMYLFEAEILVTFTMATMTFAKLLFALYVVLAVTTVVRERRWREENAFALVTLAIACLYIWSPESYAGGQLVRERLSLYLFLTPLPWLSPRLPKSVPIAVVLILTTAAIAKGVFTIDRHRHYSAIIAEYVRSYAAVKADSTVIPLLYSRVTPGMFTGVLGHAAGYAAIEKRLVNISNYEPRTGYFPVTYHPDYKPPGVYWIEATPAELDVPAYEPYGRFVVTWKMPHDAPVVRALEEQYRVIDVRGYAVVYERKLDSRFAAGDKLQRILLPIAGTSRRSPPGVWRVEQTMRNNGTEPARIALTACPDLGVCELDVNSGQTIPLAASPTDAPYIVVTARELDAQRLEFSTTVQGPAGARLSVPAVRESDFRQGRFVIGRVNSAGRLALRLWTRGTSGPVAVRIRSGSEERRVLTEADGFYIHGNFLPGARGPFEVEILGQTAAIWGFVTATEPAGNVTLHLPR